MKKVTVVLYEPEIPDNVGNIIRTCACYDIKLVIIEPIGFLWSDKNFKKAKMDYSTEIELLSSWQSFLSRVGKSRIILTTPHTSSSTQNFEFRDGDFILFGRESNGVELEIASQCSNLISIPMYGRTRSFNLATCVAMILQYV